MPKSTHFFDPVLASLYTTKLSACNITWEGNSAEIQTIFYQLNQPEPQQCTLPKAYDFIQHQLKQVAQHYATKIIPDYYPDSLTLLQTIKTPPIAKHLSTKENINRWLELTADVILTQPHWLQNISPAAASQNIVSVQLMSLYIRLTQADQQGANLQQSYYSLLLATGIKIPRLHSHNDSQQTELIPALFDFATIQLALSRFPRVLLPEMLGFTLAFCQMPSLIEVCFPDQHTTHHFYQQRQHQLEANIAPLQQCITAYLDLFPQQTQVLWQRIQQGFWLYQLLMQRSCEHFSTTLSTSLPAQPAIATLLQQKAAAAIGHHQKIQLQGQSLDQWFAGLPANTENFLQALRQSEYIDKQNPANSRLLKLFDFNGPMFGVLDEPERNILLNWLQHELKTSSAATGTLSHKNINQPTPFKSRPTIQLPIKQASYAKLNNRELYYYLINQDLFADVLPTAKCKVRKLLRRCALFNPLPFKDYSHQHFNRYIENIYQREMQAYTPLQGVPKISKAAYIWGFEQIAPMILIDGCWIQNSLSLQPAYPDISEILFSIYKDEIGSGQLQQNHPYIFRQLLNSLSIQLPAAYSQEFIKHPGFINSAFDLPVYMLALSSFSIEFLPELLGLNMAIELSGLGRSYMNLVDDWNYWGIDPSIANIHISIDNYASGHTFLAKKAIQLYMDGLVQSSSNSATLKYHWKRIYNGYASLRFVGGRFKFSLPFSYLAHKFK